MCNQHIERTSSGQAVGPSQGVGSSTESPPAKGIHTMKWVLRVLGALFVMIPLGALSYSYVKAYSDPYGQADLSGIDVPRFTEVEFPFSHQFNKNNSLPFLGSAIIDIDGDGTPEVFMDILVLNP